MSIDTLIQFVIMLTAVASLFYTIGKQKITTQAPI